MIATFVPQGSLTMTGTTMPHQKTQISLADRIAPELPYLRRYARALNGSQTSGDAYVAALLEMLIADPTVLDTDVSPRAGLYMLFQAVWSSTSAQTLDTVTDERDIRETAVADRLRPLPARSRQALLLTALEGFSLTEAAYILDTTDETVEALVAEARQELARQSSSRILIIEDEPIIAMDIEALVTEMGHSVVEVVDTHDLAVAAAIKHRPDLILADIQLADGSSGIDAVRDILAETSVPVIFITAYPDRLLTGQRPEPTFLISKPFRTETVQATVAQALFFRATVAMA